MLRHHLVFSLRDIGRRRLSAAVTIAGLAVGIAASVLIFLWVLGEFSWDRFHEDGSRIYRVIAEDLREGKAERYWQTSLPLAPALRDQPG
ncbi:MAG TPA: ABC transporter permease, partial [Alphaproteobacteria bacterium]|nr:ABC transporter permease [Alphaproteobacteria bacterium]